MRAVVTVKKFGEPVFAERTVEVKPSFDWRFVAAEKVMADFPGQIELPNGMTVNAWVPYSVMQDNHLSG